MSPMLTARPVGAREVTALSLLFARYVTGQINDVAWTQMMSILDEGDTTDHERVALFSFLNDACAELGPESVEVPRLTEVDDLVSLTRSA